MTNEEKTEQIVDGMRTEMQDVKDRRTQAFACVYADDLGGIHMAWWGGTRNLLLLSAALDAQVKDSFVQGSRDESHRGLRPVSDCDA